MIAEHPDSLASESPAATIAARPKVNGELRVLSSFSTFNCRLLPDLEQPVRSKRPHDQDQADLRDMKRLVAGEGEALQSLMERHTEPLYSQLGRILRDRTEAREAALETFVRVYLHRDRFDFEHKFSTWLYAIAFNLARDRLRWRRRRPEFVSLDDPKECEALEATLVDPEQPPDTRLDNQERYGFLAEAVEALPEGLRQPLIEFAFEDKSQPAIAAEMHCTTKAVEMRLYHARKELHDLLENSLRNGEGFCGPRRNSS